MNFPDLSEPHASALREAVSFILETFTPIGIVATGTILRGDADANSDIDLYVVHLTLKRQRLSRIYTGVPVEIFVNPPQAIRRYFESEARDGQPYTSHMLATGTVLLGESDKEFQGLLDDASRVLSHRPTPSDKFLTRERYAIATQFEDAEDIRKG